METVDERREAGTVPTPSVGRRSPRAPRSTCAFPTAARHTTTSSMQEKTRVGSRTSSGQGTTTTSGKLIKRLP